MAILVARAEISGTVLVLLENITTLTYMYAQLSLRAYSYSWTVALGHVQLQVLFGESHLYVQHCRKATALCIVKTFSLIIMCL